MYIGSRGEESQKLYDALRATGSVHFYKIPFNERRNHYSIVAQRILESHGGFLDGYFRNVCFLVEFAEKCVNKPLYVDFLKAQLTKYELILIFYLIAGRDEALGRKRAFDDLGILGDLPSCGSLMIDFPSEEILRDEMRKVFAEYSTGR